MPPNQTMLLDRFESVDQNVFTYLGLSVSHSHGWPNNMGGRTQCSGNVSSVNASVGCVVLHV